MYNMSKNNNNQTKRKQNFDLIDFYEVLGIEDRNMSAIEIRKKYAKLAIKYHPDKSKDADPQIFALIQRAWDCLGNEEKRKQYDFYLNNEKKAKKGDHNNLKKEFETFMELKQTDIEDKDKVDKAQIEFLRACEEMDKKHNRKQFQESVMTTKESSNRFNDLMLEREQQEIEFAQSRMFPEGTKFNGQTLKDFNHFFDLYKKKQNKNDKLIKKQEGPTAWNCVFEEQGFTSLDSFDKIYEENDLSNSTGLNYGDLKEFGNEMKMNMDEYENELMNTKDANYVSDHNIKGGDYMKDIERKLREREMETENLKQNKFNDYNVREDKSFMFTHEVGNIGTIEWGYDDNDDLQEACDRLIELEKFSK